MPQLMKGVGFARPGGVAPLEDDATLFGMAAKATKALKVATHEGYQNPSKVTKGFSGEFAGRFGALTGANIQQAGLSSLVADLNTQLSAALGKNFNIGTPGGNAGTPLASGFVPFDLLAPSRLLYPVYSPLRNKLARTPGQGEQRLLARAGAAPGGHVRLHARGGEHVARQRTLHELDVPRLRQLHR